jgi:thiol-disulfide isomerase/thioredoxin
VDRTPLLIVAVAVLGAAAGFALSGWLQPRPQPAVVGTAAAMIGEPLPADLDLTDLAGNARRLDEWRGRPLLINFWATWCGPCVHEMPILDALRGEQPADGLEVVGIALDDPDEVRRFLADLAVAYPILLDEPGPRDASVRLGDTRGVLPYSVLVGRDGRIRAQRAGSFDRSSLHDWIQPVLSQ